MKMQKKAIRNNYCGTTFFQATYKIGLLFFLVVGFVSCSEPTVIGQFNRENCKFSATNNHFLVRILIFTNKERTPREDNFNYADHLTSLDLCAIAKEKWGFNKGDIALISLFVKQDAGGSEKKILLNLNSTQDKGKQMIPLYEARE